MTFEQVYEQIPGSGWLSRNEAEFLWNLASVLPGPILEVGCYHGRSTCLLASFGRPVYAVDPFSGFDKDDPTGKSTLEAFMANITGRKLHNVKVYVMPVESWEPRPVELAYLDGDHTYAGTVEQLLAAQRAGARVIAVHDVNDSGEGRKVKEACVDMLGPWTERLERIAVWRLR